MEEVCFSYGDDEGEITCGGGYCDIPEYGIECFEIIAYEDPNCSDQYNSGSGPGTYTGPGGGGGSGSGSGGLPTLLPEDELIRKDPSFQGTNTDCIYEKLKSIDGFKDLASKFEGLGTEFDIKLKIGQTQSSTANAETWYKGVGQPIEITFNQTKMNRSALQVARTIVHEMVHAEMSRAINTSNPTEVELDFRETFNAYVMMYRGTGDQQHNAMANEWVTGMGSILSEVHQKLDPAGYDAFKNIYYPYGIPDHFYKSVAWEGLSGTLAWDLMQNITASPPLTSPRDVINQDLNNAGSGRKDCIPN